MPKSLSIAYGLSKRKSPIAPTKHPVQPLDEKDQLVQAVLEKRKMAKGGMVEPEDHQFMDADLDTMDDSSQPHGSILEELNENADKSEEMDEEDSIRKDLADSAYRRMKARR